MVLTGLTRLTGDSHLILYRDLSRDYLLILLNLLLE